MSLENPLNRHHADATNAAGQPQEAPMERVPFATGLENDQEPPQRGVADNAIKVLKEHREKAEEKKRRFGTKVTHKPAKMHQPYDSKLTPKIKENTDRMLGEGD